MVFNKYFITLKYHNESQLSTGFLFTRGITGTATPSTDGGWYWRTPSILAAAGAVTPTLTWMNHGPFPRSARPPTETRQACFLWRCTSSVTPWVCRTALYRVLSCIRGTRTRSQSTSFQRMIATLLRLFTERKMDPKGWLISFSIW